MRDAQVSKRKVALRDNGMDALKPDWREAKERLIDWWAGKKVDRVVAAIEAQRTGAQPHVPRGALLERYTDPVVSLDNYDDWLGRAWFGAEAFPHYRAKLGPATLGAFLGAELEFRQETIWQSRLPLTWDDTDQITFDRNNKWWRKECELMQAACERSRGRYLVFGGDGGSIADVMINLLGSEETLVATIERPEVVRKLRDRMLVWVKAVIGEYYKIVAPYQEGNIDWLHLWAPGTCKTFQCDASVMLSPESFRDLFLDEIAQECRMVDYSFYHMDGTAQFRHLDAILAIEELDGIQWTPEPTVPGNPDHFADVWRRVQDAGKRLMFFVSPHHVAPLLNSIGREGVFLSVNCKDETQAREVLRELERIGM